MLVVPGGPAAATSVCPFAVGVRGRAAAAAAAGPLRQPLPARGVARVSPRAPGQLQRVWHRRRRRPAISNAIATAVAAAVAGGGSGGGGVGVFACEVFVQLVGLEARLQAGPVPINVQPEREGRKGSVTAGRRTCEVEWDWTVQSCARAGAQIGLGGTC